LRRVNHRIISGFTSAKIIPEAIEIALSQAYIEETNRMIRHANAMQRSRDLANMM